MSLSTIRAGLVTAIKTVSGIGPVLGYPPKSIPANKTVYIASTGFEKIGLGYRWMFVARLCIQWTDAAQAEADLDGLVEGIIDAIDDTSLSGIITSGLAKVPSGDADWFTMAGSNTEWRFVDFTIAITDKSG